MKVLGFDIGRSLPPAAQKPTVWDTLPSRVQDAPAPVPIQKVDMPVIIPPAVIGSVKNPGLTYQIERGWGRGLFIPSEYDLALIGRISDVDAYVAQAFKKKIGLLLKEGYDFVGKNQRTVRYVKTRLAQIARASSIPTEQLIRNLGGGMIRKANAFVIKVRSTKMSGGKTWEGSDGKKHSPVAAYFPCPAETMEVDADGYGLIRRWRQRMPRGFIKYYLPDDIVHFKWDVKDGFIFGTPEIVPVVEDVRALRKMEENIELLIYQHLFPLFHYTVGTESAPAGVTESGEHEVDIVRRTIGHMPAEGSIVTPERHTIEMIGAEGQALDATKYLEHYKKRVFAGLGMAAVDFGEGDTANRATAETMSRALCDNVKDYQRSLECQFDQMIISELLLESTFGPDVLNEENMVHLKFFEADIVKRMEVEKHAVEMFVGNGITHDELRRAQGLETIPLPTEDDAKPEEYPDFYKTNWKLFDEPKVMIQSMKTKPTGPMGEAVASHPSTALTPEHLEKGKESEKEMEKHKAQAKAKVMPPGQSYIDHIQDNILERHYQDLEENICYAVQKGYSNYNYHDKLIRAQAARMSKHIHDTAMASFIRGYTNITRAPLHTDHLTHTVRTTEERAIKYTSRLSDSLRNTLKRHIDTCDEDDKISVVRSVFSSLKHRTALISDVESRRAYNYGVVLGLLQQGYTHIKYTTNEDCQKCSEMLKNPVALKDITMADLPPFHGHCECQMNIHIPTDLGASTTP